MLSPLILSGGSTVRNDRSGVHPRHHLHALDRETKSRVLGFVAFPHEQGGYPRHYTADAAERLARSCCLTRGTAGSAQSTARNC